MKGVQLGLFGEEIEYPDKKTEKRRCHNGRKADAIANQILRKISKEPEDIQKSIVCEIYFHTICKNLDKMPREYSRNLVARLMERYFV